MAAGDKSHLYTAAGLPVNTYVPTGQVNENKSHLAFQNQNNLFADDGIDWVNPDLTYTPNPGDSIYKDSTGNYVSQADYEKAMADRYANTVINAEGDKGYTGQGAAGGRNPITGGGGGGSVSATFSGGGGGGVGQASIPKVVLNPQDLSQRTPSGSMYAPDLSAYNDSSLFNYTGPGGLDEYTYGQNLPYQGAGYNIWGSPADAPNPYYEGQFGGGFVEPVAQGPADGAIGLPPIDLPAGVAATNNNPSVGSSNTNINTGGGSNDAGGGHDYWSEDNQRVYEMQQKRKEQADAENYDAMVAQANAWDNQMREGQLGSGFKGEEELNTDVQKTIFDSYGDEDAAFDAAGYDNFIMGDDGPFEYDDYLARNIASGMADNQAELVAKTQILNDKWDAQEAIQLQDNLFNEHFDRNQAEYTPSIRDYYPGATPMQLHQGEVLNATKEGPKTGPSGLTADDLGLFDYSADDRFRQTPQSIADVDYNARPGNFADAAGTITDGAMNTQHPAYAAHQNRLENAFQNQDTGFIPTQQMIDNDIPVYQSLIQQMETDKGSYAGSSADLGGGNVTEGGKKGPSGKDATEASRINDLQNIFGGDLGHLGHKLISDSSITDAALDKHYADKWDTGYSDRDAQGFEPLSGNEYHIRSGIDYGKLSGDKNLNLGGIPSALAGYAFQQADDFGKEGLLQATDNARGLALSGNAPAVQSIFNVVDAITSAPAKLKESKAKIETKKSEGTFKPRVVAKAKPKTTTKTKTKAKTTKTGPSGKTAKTIKKKTKPKTTNYTKTYTRRYGL
jgi:hypothetical protein